MWFLPPEGWEEPQNTNRCRGYNCQRQLHVGQLCCPTIAPSNWVDASLADGRESLYCFQCFPQSKQEMKMVDGSSADLVCNS